MIYNNYHYLELCVIIHACLLLVEVFFKGVHLECEKKNYSYNSFYRLFFKGVHLECEKKNYSYNSFYRLFGSKIFTPFFPINLIPHKIKLVLLLMKMYPDFSEITQIKMCLSSINHEDE